MEEKKRIISKSDLISDLVVGAVLIAVVIYALLTPGGWFTGLVALLGLATLVNLYNKQKEAGILNRDSEDILAVIKAEKDELAENVRLLKAEKTSLGRALDSASEEKDNAIAALTAFKEKYRVLKNDYLKLAKQNEAISNENAQLHERMDDLGKQNSDYAEKYQTAGQDLDNANQKVQELTQALEAKKTQSKTSRNSPKTGDEEPESTSADKKPRKRQYTKKDVARIKAELRSVNLKPKDDAESGK